MKKYDKNGDGRLDEKERPSREEAMEFFRSQGGGGRPGEGRPGQGGAGVCVGGQAGQDEVGEQVRFQQGSGRVNPEMAKAFGKQLGADVVVYGALRSISKTKGRSLENLGTKTKDRYYQFVLSCINVESGEILWSNEEELRKTQVISLFGS